MARPMWEIKIEHKGLGKIRVIRGSDKSIIERKAYLQEKTWNEQWEKKKEIESKRIAKEKAVLEKESKRQLAIEKTLEAQKSIEKIENTLKYTLSIKHRIDWETLKDESNFEKPFPQKPSLKIIPDEPKFSDSKYNPKLTVLDKIFSSKKIKKMQKAEREFSDDLDKWKDEKMKLDQENQRLQDNFESQVKQWEEDKEQFLNDQKQKNISVDNRKNNYCLFMPEAVIDYCDMVLANSKYPDNFPQEYDLEYDSDTKILIVDYSLPAPEHLPILKEVKYIQSKDEFSEMQISETTHKKLYDNLLYQISLRTIHELYEADSINSLESIVFNGWVRTIDKSTGNEVNTCVMSIQANKNEFLSINLSLVDPKECFKKLKGVGSSKLHGLSAIPPIMKINKEDKRFVTSIDVADKIDDSVNIAAMDWEEFEHLVREIFQKEFTQSGGEVKITRASRDGGVDAVAFDPDPIRGGKIVIQAKRYTNVVGVSAVRDLYGTVMNEGAIKGILVTTAKYGPDAYNFAKDKPITLLDGGNLLHLLERHGVKAKIDLKEAKQILGDK